jgi:dephospho-CoA kinase
MSIKHIIALVGLPGAGKSQACNFFKQKNIPVIRFGEITDVALRLKGLPSTEMHEKAFRENLRQEFGMAAFAIKNEAKIREALKIADIIVLDGLRSWEEYVYLKEKFTPHHNGAGFINLRLLAVYASPRIRHQRLKERSVRNFSIEEAKSRDISEVENLHIAPTIAMSDHLIKNETTLESLNQQLEMFLKEIVKN